MIDDIASLPQDLEGDFEYSPSRYRAGGEPGGLKPADLRERLAAAQAALAAREAGRAPPLLQDAHPEVGGGVQARTKDRGSPSRPSKND